MNKIYKVIWSEVRNCYVAVSEIAKRNGKSCTSVHCGARITGSRAARVVCALLLGSYLVGGFSLPVAVAGGEVSVGTGAAATGDNSTAVGSNAKAEGKLSTAVGEQAAATGDNSTAVGGIIAATGNYSTAVGYQASSSSEGSVAVGKGSSAVERYAVAIGNGSVARNGFSVAIGSGAVAEGLNSLAVGYSAKASGKESIALGFGAEATADNSIAFGAYSQVTAENSVAMIGGNVASSANNALAIGNGASATLQDSIALGSGSVANRALGDEKARYKGTNTGVAWISTKNAIAVGDGTKATRQIIGVAAGSEDTDAVNVAQLKAGLATVSGGGGGATYTAGKGISLGDDNKIAVKAGDGLAFDKDSDDANLKVNAGDGLTFDNGALKVKTGSDLSIADDGSMQVNKTGEVEEDNNSLVTGGTVYSAITGKGIAFTGDDGSSGVIKLDEKLAVNGDSNITTEASEGKVAVKLNNNLDLGSVGSVTIGDAKFSGNGVTVNGMELAEKGLTIDGGPSVTNSGIDAGRYRITNVADGINDTDAVTVAQLNNATSGLTSGGLKFGANSGTAVTNKLGSTVNVAGVAAADGHTYSANNVTTEITQDSDGNSTITVKLDENPEFKSVTATGNVSGADIAAGGTLSGKTLVVDGKDVTNALTTDGKVEKDNEGFMTGGTVYSELRPVDDGKYIKKDNTTAANLTALDTAIANKADAADVTALTGKVETNEKNIDKNTKAIEKHAEAIEKNASDISSLGKRVTANETELSKKADKTELEAVKTTADSAKDKADKLEKEIGVSGDTIVLGNGSESGAAAGNNVIAIGFASEGVKNNASGEQSIAIGFGNQVTGNHSGAFGDPTYIAADNSYALGNSNNITASGARSFAIGNNNTISGSDTFVLGSNVNANVNNAVVLGNNSTAEANSVSVGSAGGGERQIKHVKAGTEDTDAATVAQVNAVGQNAYSNAVYLNNSINKVDSKVNKVGAGAAALAALHPIDTDDKFTMGLGYGNYRDAHSAAIGMFYRPTEKIMLSVGGALGNGENMMNVGISFALDKGKGFGTSKAAMARKIAAQDEEIAALKEAHAKETAEQKAEIQVLKEALARLEAKIGK